MNNTVMNSTNSTTTPNTPVAPFFFTYEQVYSLFGYYFSYTVMYTALGSVSIIACMLNLVSFWILSNKREFSIPIYTYMRIYTLSGTVSSFTNGVSYLIINSAHFTHLYNLYLSGFFGTYIYYVLLQTGYTFATLLDILISLDRIALFNKPTKKFLKCFGYYTSPYKICSALYFVCTVVGAFAGWLSGRESITLPMEGGKYVTFWYTILGNQALNYTLWLVLSYLIYIVRDILTLITLIVVSIVQVIVYRNYIIKRLSLFNSNQQGGASLEGSVIMTRTEHRTHLDSNTAISGRVRSERITGMDKKLVSMTSILCLFGIFEHVVAMVFLVIMLTVASGGDLTTLSNYISIIFWVYNLAVTLKQCSGFFLLFGFNTVFRNEIKKKWAKLRGRH